jgi:two-component system, OmpR family, phosphate regulon sensor histidine kinase PhoR
LLKSFLKQILNSSFDSNLGENLRKFNILIGLMLLALIGLVAFQWYWIQNAIAIKNEQFDRKVLDILTETSRKIEKQEVIYLAKQRMISNEKNRLVNISKKPSRKSKKIELKPQEVDVTAHSQTDSMNFAYSEGNVIKIEPREVFSIDINSRNMSTNDVLGNRFFIFPESEAQFIKGFLDEEQRNVERFRKRSFDLARKQKSINELISLMNASGFTDDFPEQERHTINFYFNPGNNQPENFSLQKDKEEPKRNQRRRNAAAEKKAPKNNTSEKSEKVDLVKDVFTEFILGKRSIDERLGQLMLDTLLQAEFKNNGINLPYKYGVKDNGNIVFASFSHNEAQNPLQKAYRVKLFPNDTYSQEQYLHVYFPEKENYILGNLWKIFGSSLVLITMVGGIFYYSVNTMLSQKKLSNIKTDFINNMTHELKTPVSTIGLALEVIRDKDIEKSPEKTERYLNIIGDENKRLGTQIEKVLQIAQLERGDINLRFETLDVNEVVEHVVASMGVQLEQQMVKLETNFTAKWPSVAADKVHLTNIFVNLIDNAIKYSQQNPEITLSTENTTSGVAIKIKDNGIGIPKDQISKIFDKFYRVPKGNLHDVKGFGLGLSYVKSMLELHGGTIAVESKINEGSEFIITLPNA